MDGICTTHDFHYSCTGLCLEFESKTIFLQLGLGVFGHCLDLDSRLIPVTSTMLRIRFVVCDPLCATMSVCALNTDVKAGFIHPKEKHLFTWSESFRFSLALDSKSTLFWS